MFTTPLVIIPSKSVCLCFVIFTLLFSNVAKATVSIVNPNLQTVWRKAARRELSQGGWTSDLVEYYQDKPKLRKYHVIYVQRPFEDPAVSAANYARRIDETIQQQNWAMEFHSVPFRIVKGNVYVKDASYYYEVKDKCATSLQICRDWANEYGRTENSWDVWQCSLPSSWHPDCGGLAWEPGDVSFMGEYSWYDSMEDGQGDNGILHEMGHNFNAQHHSDFCYPEFDPNSDDIGWITMMGGGNGCAWPNGAEKIYVYTDAAKQYTEGDRTVTLGDSDNDNGSRMRQQLHDLLAADWNFPICPEADFRNVCRNTENQFCDSHTNLGKFDAREDCAQYILDNPAKCISGLFAFATSAPSWGCRCCLEGSTTHDHSFWSLYESKIGTLSPSLKPTFIPTPKPTDISEFSTTPRPTPPPVSIELVSSNTACDFSSTITANTLGECAEWIKAYPGSCPSGYFASAAADWDCRCCETSEEANWSPHNWWSTFRVLDEPASTAERYFDPAKDSCPRGYVLQVGQRIENPVSCSGTLYAWSCILSKADAEAFCQMITCYAVSGTSNTNWLASYPDSDAVEISIESPTFTSHGNWNSCVKQDECIDGEEDVSSPCEPRYCDNGLWESFIIDCAEEVGQECNVGLVDPTEGQCCSTCPCDTIVCAQVVCPDGSNPPIPAGECCSDINLCEKQIQTGEVTHSVQMDFTVNGVDESNFDEFEPPFKAGVSEVTGQDERDITVSLKSSERRRLADRTVFVKLAAYSAEGALSLSSMISQMPKSEMLSTISDKLEEANIVGVTVQDISGPEVVVIADTDDNTNNDGTTAAADDETTAAPTEDQNNNSAAGALSLIFAALVALVY